MSKNTIKYYLRPKPYVTVTDVNEFNKIIQTNDRVVVDFSATWCGPCKMIAPVFQQLAADYSQIKCVKIDINESPMITQSHNIKSIPTFLFYRQGVQVSQFSGADKGRLQKEFSHL
ncbi:Thioredoxin [Entamoeba marina]